MHRTARALALVLCTLAAACGGAPPPPPTVPSASGFDVATLRVPDHVRAAVDAPDREEADRALDAGRHPAELLAIFGVAPGMRVGEIASGGGYTTELLARVVGPTGVVHGQNSPFILARFAEAPWTARLEKPVMAHVVRHDTEFDDPFGADVRDLDVVVNVLFYHDTVWIGTDRDAMNRAVFAALRPGGRYVLVDHAARVGDGATVTESLHRIEERVVREEVERAGFRLVGTSDVLRAPEDTRDWSASPRTAGERRGTSDRFVLVFERP